MVQLSNDGYCLIVLKNCHFNLYGMVCLIKSSLSQIDCHSDLVSSILYVDWANPLDVTGLYILYLLS